MTYICIRFPTRWLTFCGSFWFLFSILIVQKKLQRSLSVHRVTIQVVEFFPFLEACLLGRGLINQFKIYPVPDSYIFLLVLLCCNGTVSLGFTTQVKIIRVVWLFGLYFLLTPLANTVPHCWTCVILSQCYQTAFVSTSTLTCTIQGLVLYPEI